MNRCANSPAEVRAVELLPQNGVLVASRRWDSNGARLCMASEGQTLEAMVRQALLALPQAPQRDGWSDTAPNNLLRSDMETGPAKVRRRGNARPHVAQGTYVMNDEEAAVFEAFALDTLAGGALSFDWWHPVLERYVRARLAPGESGLFNRSYWGGTYAWQYSLTIEYWPDVPVDAEV